MLNINRPTLVIDKALCMSNIHNMVEKAHKHRIKFRPHFKTHQSATIGNWFRDTGVTSITVSSVSMARYFAQNGWDDITIAFPVNVLEASDINELAENITLNILVENVSALTMLKSKLTAKLGIYIEIDTGNFRSGIEINRINQVDELISIMKGCRFIEFKGFLSHSGQTYASRSVDDILLKHADALLKMRSVKEHYIKSWPGLEVSLGDTPACTLSDNFDRVDEIRPGNFVFYDLMQEHLGVCERSDIAAKVYCPVVSRHLSRNEFVIYGGAVHLSKEFIINKFSKKSYGAIGACCVDTGAQAGENTWVAGLSQEHGIIRAGFDDIREFKIGGLTEIIPVHSCLAADLAGYYLTTDGERIEKMSKMV
jgi:D-serine deaminase-like pyridoxal phosphate-dependent protein